MWVWVCVLFRTVAAEDSSNHCVSRFGVTGNGHSVCYNSSMESSTSSSSSAFSIVGSASFSTSTT